MHLWKHGYVQLNIIYLYLNFVICEYVIRDTVYGKIRGFVSNRGTNINVEQYLGIPYATPPIGNLRFEEPRLPTRWKNILDALHIPPACLQTSYGYIQIHKPGFNRSSEDCLYLNVYVPQQKTKARLSVLLYIHGGSNLAGMGAMFDGDVLAGYGNIIVITFNYRLGVYGFMAAKQEGLDGNYGFLDQVAAMTWVKENVHFFGGDPTSVTLYGHSAGAIDVALHMVSRLSKGLFRYAVVHSASPFAFLAMVPPDWPDGYNIEMDSVRMFCPKDSNISVKQCLKNLTMNQLFAIRGKPKINELLIFDFPIIIDGNFLTTSPEESFMEGNFSGEAFLFSFTSGERSSSKAVVPHGLKFKLSSKSNSGSKLLRKKMVETFGLYQRAYPGVCLLSDKILEEYDIWNTTSYTATLQGFEEVESDFHFVAPIIHLANLVSNFTKDVYVTRCDHQHNKGMFHGLDMFYVFGNPLIGHQKLQYTSEDVQFSKFMMKIYSNFVKHGFLTLDGSNRFSSYNLSEKIVNALERKNGQFVTKLHKFKERKMKFWNEDLPVLSKKYSGQICSACSRKFVNTWLTILIFCFFLVM